MSRPQSRNQVLAPSTITGIRKLYNGNSSVFFQKYLSPVIKDQSFYAAMRMDYITIEEEDFIESAFQQACINNFIQPEELDVLPTFSELISQLSKALDVAHNNPDVFDIALFIKHFYISIRFYNLKLEEGHIDFSKGKKSILL